MFYFSNLSLCFRPKESENVVPDVNFFSLQTNLNHPNVCGMKSDQFCNEWQEFSHKCGRVQKYGYGCWL